MSSGDPTSRGPGAAAPGSVPPPGLDGADPPGGGGDLDLRAAPLGGGPAPTAAPPRAASQPALGRRADLRVPAEPQSLRLARLVVAGVAADLGFTLDEVEDVRVAVDEACGAVMSPGGGIAHLHLTVDVAADAAGFRLEVAARCEPMVPPLVDAVPALLLEHTTDGWQATDGQLRFWRTGAVARG